MNSIAANGDTELDAGPNRSHIKARIISAAVLAPVVIGVIFLGSPWFDALIVLAVALMGFEWGRMAFAGPRIQVFFFSGALALVALLTATSSGGTAVLVMIGGAVAVSVSLLLCGRNPVLLSVIAFCGIGATGIGLIWLRGLPEIGIELLIWLLVTVWATDTGAYFSGKTIGGPKLAPQISPGKTWAGLIGGVVLAAAWGAAFSSFSEIGSPFALALVSAVLALFAQAGDLSVSVAKRRFAVKDAGRLIPGHGGLLDRADGLIGTAPLVAAMMALLGGEIPAWI